jgi:RNA polymerase sigma-70 factor, ECF subfamily
VPPPKDLRTLREVRSAEAANEAELAGLLNDMAHGDQRAAEELYRRVGRLMYGVALRILRDEGLAENAVHQAYVRAWQYAHTFDPAKGRPSGWLTVLARRAALDARPREPSVPLENLSVPPLDESYIHPRLRRALAEMPPKQCEAVLLMYIYGLTHAELAESMGAPLGTVKSWVRRGTAFLKEALSAPAETSSG